MPPVLWLTQSGRRQLQTWGRRALLFLGCTYNAVHESGADEPRRRCRVRRQYCREMIFYLRIEGADCRLVAHSIVPHHYGLITVLWGVRWYALSSLVVYQSHTASVRRPKSSRCVKIFIHRRVFPLSSLSKLSVPSAAPHHLLFAFNIPCRSCPCISSFSWFLSFTLTLL